VKSSQFVSIFCFRIIWCLSVSCLLEDLGLFRNIAVVDLSVL